MKILLAHTPTDMGCAKDYIAGLARDLKLRGHDVTVASFGGKYNVSEGIGHVEMPPSPSTFKLKSLIKREKYDIVHAHSCITASLCGKLARRMKFAFVTTVHAVSEDAPAFLSSYDWGDHVFAMSCDIKQHLIDTFGVPSDNITLTEGTADEYLEVYAKFVPCLKYKHGDIIISGYYGYDNIGDDSILTPLIGGIKERLPDAKITVLARNPKKVEHICRVRTLNRFNLFSIWREMKHAKLLISGGGSLLQDGTSKKSLLYYAYIMRSAKRHGLRVMVYANGLGPLSAPSSREAAAKAISCADYISFRERSSLELLGELGVSRDDARVTADPALLLSAAQDKWVDYIEAREGISAPYFIVSIKDGNTFNGAKTDGDVLDSLAADIREISEKYSLTPLYIPMYVGRDGAITKRLADMVGRGVVVEKLTASELCGLIKRARFVVGTRLHMLIFAASMAVPMIGITYDPKIDAFLDYINRRENMLDIRTFKQGELVAACEAIVKDEDAIREQLDSFVNMLRLKAYEDCDAVKTIIQSK